MKLIWKIILITIAAGLILLIIGLSLGASRVLYLDSAGVHVSGNGMTLTSEPILTGFKNIHIDAGFSNVEFISSDRYAVEFYGENTEWQWKLEGDTLNITHNQNTRIQIMNITFESIGQNYVKIYLPENVELETVTIKNNSGDTKLANFRADDVDINNSFGSVELSNIISGSMSVDVRSGGFSGTYLNVGSLEYKSGFGDGHFQSVTADSFRAESNSGYLQLNGCKFGEIAITTGFGDLTADNLISSKSNIRANSGNVRITGALTGETIIYNGFGDVKLTTSGERADYSYDISVKFGDIKFDGEKRDQSAVLSGSTQENHLKITSSSGDIEVAFTG